MRGSFADWRKATEHLIESDVFQIGAPVTKRSYNSVCNVEACGGLLAVSDDVPERDPAKLKPLPEHLRGILEYVPVPGTPGGRTGEVNRIMEKLLKK